MEARIRQLQATLQDRRGGRAAAGDPGDRRRRDRRRHPLRGRRRHRALLRRLDRGAPGGCRRDLSGIPSRQGSHRPRAGGHGRVRSARRHPPRGDRRRRRPETGGMQKSNCADPGPSPTRFGTVMSSGPPRASPTSCTSISTSSTRSPPLRRSTGSGCRAERCAVRT